jgi:hypothetical protein
VSLDLRIQEPGESAYAKMLWSHPMITGEAGELEVAALNDFLWVPYWRPCMECGEPTTWIDLSFEAPLHPGRCSEKAWDSYQWANAMAHLRDVVDDMVRKHRTKESTQRKEQKKRHGI